MIVDVVFTVVVKEDVVDDITGWIDLIVAVDGFCRCCFIVILSSSQFVNIVGIFAVILVVVVFDDDDDDDVDIDLVDPTVTPSSITRTLTIFVVDCFFSRSFLVDFFFSLSLLFSVVCPV